jgi:hypothetical protein
MRGVGYLEEIFRAIGNRAVRYFGDLDPPGLRILRLASAKAAGLGLPMTEPDLWSYRRLLELGSQKARPESRPLECEPEDMKWLQTLANQAAGLFARHCWLPQEHVGWEFLRNATWLPADNEKL